jgi:hypothetical protein
MNWFFFYGQLFILEGTFTIVNSSNMAANILRCVVPFLCQGRIPPFYPGSLPAERDICHRFDLADPVSKIRCVVYDERGTVFRKDIFEEPEEKYVSVRFLHRFTVIPGRGTNKTVICSLIPSVEKGAAVPVLQAAQRFDTFQDIFYGNPFAEILKEAVAE